jgi:hypothetical protein
MVTSDSMRAALRRLWEPCCAVAIGCGGSTSQPPSNASTSDSGAMADARMVGAGGDAALEGVVDSAAGSQDSAANDGGCAPVSGCPLSCACAASVEVAPAAACQMLEERIQVNGYIGPDSPPTGEACAAACGTGMACYLSPAYVQQAQDANGNSSGPFDAGAFICPTFPCSVTVACAPASC